MLVYKKYNMKKALYLFLVLSVSFSACRKKETQENYVYEIKDVSVKKDISEKTNQKTTTEFVSIAYSDVFGTTISSSTLVNLSTAYDAFGDKKLMEDLIIRNFLATAGAQIPTTSDMNADVDGFIKSTYNKLLDRDPNEFELYSVKKIIQDNSMTPELIYYAILTSNEYRYY